MRDQNLAMEKDQIRPKLTAQRVIINSKEVLSRQNVDKSLDVEIISSVA